MQNGRVQKHKAQLYGRCHAAVKRVASPPFTWIGCPYRIRSELPVKVCGAPIPRPADPVRAGLVESLSRPGGNITGIVGITDQLITKRLEVVGQLLPNASVIGALLNPSNPNFERRASDLRAAAAVIGRQIFIVQASHSD